MASHTRCRSVLAQARLFLALALLAVVLGNFVTGTRAFPDFFKRGGKGDAASATAKGGAECPLKAAGCPYYSAALSASPPLSSLDLSKATDCPLASKCPILRAKQSEGGSKGKENVKEFLSHVDLKEALEKCPYLTDGGALQGAHKGCPLKEAGCPYYQAIKSGDPSKLNWSRATECPLASKCPVLRAKAAEGGNAKVADYISHEDVAQLAEKCPYLSSKAAGKGGEELHAGCPLKEAGCPYYDAIVKGESPSKLDWSRAAECPLVSKCPALQNKDFTTLTQSDIEAAVRKCPYLAHAPGHFAGGKDVPLFKDERTAAAAAKAGCPFFKAMRADEVDGKVAESTSSWDRFRALVLPFEHASLNAAGAGFWVLVGASAAFILARLTAGGGKAVEKKKKSE